MSQEDHCGNLKAEMPEPFWQCKYIEEPEIPEKDAHNFLQKYKPASSAFDKTAV